MSIQADNDDFADDESFGYDPFETLPCEECGRMVEPLHMDDWVESGDRKEDGRLEPSDLKVICSCCRSSLGIVTGFDTYAFSKLENGRFRTSKGTAAGAVVREMSKAKLAGCLFSYSLSLYVDALGDGILKLAGGKFPLLKGAAVGVVAAVLAGWAFGGDVKPTLTIESVRDRVNAAYFEAIAIQKDVEAVLPELRVAEPTVSSRTDRGWWVTTLGATRYRLEQTEKALLASEQEDRERAAKAEKEYEEFQRKAREEQAEQDRKDEAMFQAIEEEAAKARERETGKRWQLPKH
ncbi:hypothetical protein BB934_45560 (plasmid) [Microvirga ossetica]|uniref:Uncharacterized protein n=1 Tax=Microvirga ossetica TaxID=1882682 RepID=A0A1B2EZR9_9HYPH|nr:hypothetical protein [Microvirga ossetica]ANY85490.1 hypothetical protein BB934_45560 [Microvirga ossetica]